MGTDPTLLQLVQEIHRDVRELRAEHSGLETRVDVLEQDYGKVKAFGKILLWAIPIILPLLWSAGCFAR